MLRGLKEIIMFKRGTSNFVGPDPCSMLSMRVRLLAFDAPDLRRAQDGHASVNKALDLAHLLAIYSVVAHEIPEPCLAAQR